MINNYELINKNKINNIQHTIKLAGNAVCPASHSILYFALLTESGLAHALSQCRSLSLVLACALSLCTALPHLIGSINTIGAPRLKPV